MVKELSDGVTETKYCKNFERNSHWRKLSMIMVWERYCTAFPKVRILFIFFVYIFIHISANMSPFGLKFSQMILHTDTNKLMYNWSFLFVVLHKPTLLPSTFNSFPPPLFWQYNDFLFLFVWYPQSQTTLTTNDIVINKLTQILSYLRQGQRGKKLKKKDKGILLYI